MPKAIGVDFKPGGKVFLYDPQDMVLVPGDEVVVPAAHGIGYGRVVMPAREVSPDEISEPLKKVIRKVTPRDREEWLEKEEKRLEAYRVAHRLIQKHGLQMKLVDVDYSLDGSSAIFYFTAEGRVDFRQLVRDLAPELKMRIELRQVGVRDEAKIVGGLGPCGRDLCCRLFMSDFEPVSIKMAKEQDLPLNPSKISGICGRLMCCLKFEVEVYEEFNRKAPPIGSKLDCEEGEGTVVGYIVPRELLIVELESGQRINVPIGSVLPAKRRQSKKEKNRKSEEN